MDAIIQMMIQGYIDGLDNLKTDNQSFLQEIADYKKELIAFAEGQNDPATFFPNFQEAGLMGKYMDITAKVTLAAQAENAAPTEEQQEKHIVTPAEWLKPFRTAYDSIKNYPIRERGLAVYRRLFEIGEKNSDITEFLTEVEQDNLLWKLSSEDTLGILEITLTGMDQLYKGLTYNTVKNIEAWEASICEADAYYLQDLLAADTARIQPRILQPEHYVICLGTHLMVYRGPHGKEGIMEMIASGNCPEPQFKANASNMAIARLQARRTMAIIQKALGLSFDDIMGDEYLKYRLISSANICGLSKAYVQSNPNILELLADAYRNEIVPDIPLIDAIKREPSLKLGRWRMPEDRESEKAKKIARSRLQDLPYFRYEDQLQGSIHVGSGEGFDIQLPA